MSRRALWVAAAGLALLAAVMAIGPRPQTQAPVAREATTEPGDAPVTSAGRPAKVASAPPAGLVALRVRVVDDAGHPIAGAKLAMRPAEAREHDETDDLEGETDAKGAFEALVKPGVFGVEASAAGFAASDDETRAGGEPLTLVLAHGLGVSGRVVREDTGAPVGGIEVRSWGSCWRREPARTDAAGHFQLQDASAGDCQLRALGPGLLSPHSEWVSLVAGRPSPEVRLVVHEVAELRGRIELSPSGAPCPGGSVVLTGDGDTHTAIAGEDGEVYFPAPHPDWSRALVSCPSHRRTELFRGLHVKVEGGRATFAIPEGLAIRGIVVDETGAPARGRLEVQVSLAGVHRNFWELVPTVDVAADGRFELRGLEAGTHSVRVVAPHSGGPGRAPPAIEVTLAAGRPTPELRLVHPSQHDLEGRLVDEKGRPVAGLWLDVAAAGVAEPSPAARTSADGHFFLPSLWPGPVRIVASRDAPSPLRYDGWVTMPHEGSITLVAGPPPTKPEELAKAEPRLDPPESETETEATVEDDDRPDVGTAGGSPP